MSGVCETHLYIYQCVVLTSGLTDCLTSREWNMHTVCSDSMPGSSSGSQTLLPRCPTECRLSSSEDSWQAKVSIRLSVDKYGGPLDKTTITPFGDAITSKLDIEERIKRAQLAILNPSIPANNFLTVDLPFSQPNESRFSKNSIILEISGPTVDDLVFVDLPGLHPATLLWHTTNCTFQVLLFLGAPMQMMETLKTSRTLSAVISRSRTASSSL